ncbi:MAG: hypothetical protein ACOC0N_00890 [Chroococcales cyanobacterium]
MLSKSSRFLSFFVALLLLLGVTACGGGEEGGELGEEGFGEEQEELEEGGEFGEEQEELEEGGEFGEEGFGEEEE